MQTTDHERALPHTDLQSLPYISDDECLVRLANAVENHDGDRLDEVALLIARLAVPIEL